VIFNNRTFNEINSEWKIRKIFRRRFDETYLDDHNGKMAGLGLPQSRGQMGACSRAVAVTHSFGTDTSRLAHIDHVSPTQLARQRKHEDDQQAASIGSVSQCLSIRFVKEIGRCGRRVRQLQVVVL
jgi:hypothetical protein